MKMGVADRVLDESGNTIGHYTYMKGSDRYQILHRSPFTSQYLAYVRSNISGKLDDGRKFKGHVDAAPGVIDSAAWERKYGIPSSIVDVKFNRR